MIKIDVLIEGVADFSQEVWSDYCTTTLVTTSDGSKILVDPGSDRSLLLNKLNEREIKVSDIEYVFLTHAHLDHTLLAGIFPNAIIVTGSQWVKAGTEIHNHDGSYFGDIIKIIKSEGHSPSDSYLMIYEEKKITCIAGDLFWWDKNDVQETEVEKIILHNDRFAIDFDKLKQTRKTILQSAHFVIPGHGKPFIIQE